MFRAEQEENIPLMLITFAVLNFVTSIEVSDEQPKNILLMSVTFSVFRFSMPSMVASVLQIQNQQEVVVGL